MTDHTDDTPRYTQADLEAVAERVREACAASCQEWQAYTKYAQEPIAREMADEIRALDLTPYTKGKSDE